jgi:hypothetical protein
MSPLVHSRRKKLLCAIPVFGLWLIGIAVFLTLNAKP